METLPARRRLAEEISRGLYEPGAAKAACNLALIYKDDKPDEAEKLFLEALGIYQRLAEKKSRDKYGIKVIFITTNLAILYMKNGKPEEAEQRFTEALRIIQNIPDEVSEEQKEMIKEYSVLTYMNYADLCKEQGRFEEAERYRRKAKIIAG